MIRLVTISVSAIISGVWADPVAAQDVDPAFNEDQQIGTRFQREPESADAAEARWMQKRVANCTFNRNREESVELLANSNFYQIDFDGLGWSSDEFWDDFEINHCIGRLMRGADNRTISMYMQIQYSTLRNLLAEEAYLRDNDSPPVIPADAVPDIAARFGGQRMHPQITTMASLADCVVYNAPETAHEVLESRPGSGGEGELVDALGPVIARCAGSSDTMTVSASLVRQMVADGLWSRSYYGSNTAAEADTLASTQAAADANSGVEERVAQCIVENDPDAARAILAAASQQEFTEAVMAIMPTCPINGSINSQSLNRALDDALEDTTA